MFWAHSYTETKDNTVLGAQWDKSFNSKDM